MIKQNEDRVFDIINYILLSTVFVIILYPLIFTVVSSISDPKLVGTGQIWLLPRGIQLDAYKNVLKNDEIWLGYRNTILYALVGTSINLAFTITCAFAMARKHLVGKNIIMGIFVFTMYFSGGLIPTYMLMRDLNLINTRWIMVLPGAMSVFNMIITRTYYSSNVPEELYEAAKIDGCADFRMFFKIAIPLSTPIIAVMALFYGVGHWNQFFNALIYLDDRKLYPLQMILRNILIMNQELIMDLSSMSSEEIEYMARRAWMAETMKYALIFIASFPVLVAYPFLQRYFVKGVMIGALKG